MRSSVGDEMHEPGRFFNRKMQRKSISPLQSDCQGVKFNGMELKASCDRGTEELIGRPITVQHCHDSFISNVSFVMRPSLIDFHLSVYIISACQTQVCIGCLLKKET